MGKNAIILGSLLGALAVGLGAFGAHGLAEFLESSGRAETYETAVKYHFYHSLLLVILGLLDGRISIRIPFYFISTGILLFSGSLYTLVFTNITFFGMITPVGGIALILGWLSIAFKARKLTG